MFLHLLFLLLSTALYGACQDPYVWAVEEREPAPAFCPLVNPLSGDLTLEATDLVIEGAVPLVLKRFFLSAGGVGGWEFFPHTKLYLFDGRRERKKYLRVAEPSAAPMVYTREHGDSRHYSLDFAKHGKGISNASRGVIGGSTSLRNHQFVRSKGRVLMTAGDGTRRSYFKKRRGFYLLGEERLPSGHHLLYSYDKYDRLLSVTSMDPAKQKRFARLNFLYESRPSLSGNFTIKASDGRRVHYEVQAGKLMSVSLPDGTEERFSYEKGESPRLCKILYRDGRKLKIRYGKPDSISSGSRAKVRKLLETVGDALLPTYRFAYKTQGTGVEEGEQSVVEIADAEGNITRLHFTPTLQVGEIVRFSGDRLHSRQLFSWDQQGQLLSKALLDSSGRCLRERRFVYDERGNVRRESLLGELTEEGRGEEHSTFYTYDTSNRICSRQEEGGALSLYDYLPGTTLLANCSVMEGSSLFSSEQRFYDSAHLLKEVRLEEGGVCKGTRYSYEHRGLPEQVAEFYCEGGREIPLTTVRIQYTREGWPRERTLFDGEGRERYTLAFAYNPSGQLIAESNPIGEWAKFRYDCFGHEIEALPFTGPRQKKRYDRSGRLIHLEESSAEGEKRARTFIYDLLGRVIEESDHLGRKTRYRYDLAGNLVEKVLPAVEGKTAVFLYCYDPLGSCTATTTPEGHTTRVRSNSRGDPLSITYPDGSTKTYRYNAIGTLREQIDPLGWSTEYVYDQLQRLRLKRSAGVAEEHYHYEGSHLCSHVDRAGLTHYYAYDGAGRKRAERVGEKERLYRYDSLGRVETIEEGTLTQSTRYDLLDRIVESREEERGGALLSKRHYVYDRSGQVVEARVFEGDKSASERFLYDAWGRLLEQCDPLGSRTRYDYAALEEREVDPLGRERLTRKDALERIVSVERRGPEGERISFEAFTYDLDGNQIRSVAQGALAIAWQRDSMGRVTCLIEAEGTPEERSTYYAYNARGERTSLLKPDGTQVDFCYDALGRLERVSSSAGDLCYCYAYEGGSGAIFRVQDLISGQVTDRGYTELGDLIYERLGNGLALSAERDERGRRTALHLPDGSSIGYRYSAKHLSAVTRYGADGRERYSHRYLRYTMRGQPAESALIASLGALCYTIDLSGRRDALFTPYLSQKVEHDPCGNLVRLISNGEERSFAYDALGQLLSDGFHTYDVDPLSRRLAKDGAADAPTLLNQVTSRFVYDRAGRPVTDLVDGTCFAYDSLDRLVSVTKPGVVRYRYTYDPFHRRLSSREELWQQGYWQEGKTLLFLYDLEEEIGAVDDSGRIVQLRLLGEGEGAEIGAAVACEIEGALYAPIHDLFGNVALLLDREGLVAAEYRYTAFGETLAHNPLSPWRFSSKRTDPTGLVYFGRRYYLPELGRWLTPDPAGFVDGPNRYAYLGHAPLGAHDLYGLFAKPVDLLSNLLGGALEHAYWMTPSFHRYMYGVGQDLSYPLSYYPPQRKAHTRALPKGCIIFLGGIQSSEQALMGHLVYLSQLGGGVPVHTLVEPSCSMGLDLALAFATRRSRRNAVVDATAELIREKSAQVGADGGVLLSTHSRGSLNAFYALSLLEQEEKSRLEMVNIAPAKIILRESGVKSAINYISQDPIPYWDSQGIKAGAVEESLIRLMPHPDLSSWWDHDFQSPTYTLPLRKHLTDFTERFDCE